RSDMFAGDEFGQVFFLLRQVAIEADLVDAEVGVRAVGEADRGGGAADFLHGYDVGEVAEFGPEIAREFVRTVDLRGAGGDFGRGKFGDGVAQLGQFGGEVETHAR